MLWRKDRVIYNEYTRIWCRMDIKLVTPSINRERCTIRYGDKKMYYSIWRQCSGPSKEAVLNTQAWNWVNFVTLQNATIIGFHKDKINTVQLKFLCYMVSTSKEAPCMWWNLGDGNFLYLCAYGTIFWKNLAQSPVQQVSTDMHLTF